MRNEMIIEMVNEILDSEGDVRIGNLTFSRSEIVRRLDPIAYRQMCLDIVDSHIEDLQYELDSTDDEEERAFILDRIAELEDF